MSQGTTEKSTGNDGDGDIVWPVDDDDDDAGDEVFDAGEARNDRGFDHEEEERKGTRKGVFRRVLNNFWNRIFGGGHS